MTAGTASPSELAAVHADRLTRARDGVGASGAGALLIGIGADLRYLTGHTAHPLERLTMLVLPADGPTTLIAPRLEAMAAAASPAAFGGLVDVVAWDETDDAYSVVAGQLAEAGVDPEARLLVDPGLWAMHVLGLQRALPGRGFGLATEVTRGLRMTKSPDEIERLRAAAHAADRVVLRIAAGRLVGRTEADVSREVRERLVDEGHESASFAIVASGPNSASPHHDPGDRTIQPGDPIVLDIGGVRQGYCSDITRTLWVTGGDPDGEPDPEFLTIFGLVREAKCGGDPGRPAGGHVRRRSMVSRGRSSRRAGTATRSCIGLGHGIGLEAHEEPYLVAGNAEPLEPGHAFSIEPGIYLAGRYGVRIEDIVVCRQGGADVLNEAPRDLLVVPG